MNVHLVDGDDYRYLCRLCVVYALNSLGHYSVVSGNDENGDISYHCAAGSHRGERLVTRGVEEGDVSAVYCNSVGADMLGYAACLSGGDVRLADIVEKARFAVVNVTHNDDDGGAGEKLILVILRIVDKLFLDSDYDLALDLAAHLLGDYRGGVEVDNVGKGSHNAVLHKRLYDLGSGLLHSGGELADVNLVGDLYLDGRLLRDLKLEALHTVALLLAALVRLGLILLLAAGLLLDLLLAAAGVLILSCAVACHILKALVVLFDVYRNAGGVDNPLLRLALGLTRLLLLLWLGGLTVSLGGSGGPCLLLGSRGLSLLLVGSRLLLLSLGCGVGKYLGDAFHLIG